MNMEAGVQCRCHRWPMSWSIVTTLIVFHMPASTNAFGITLKNIVRRSTSPDLERISLVSVHHTSSTNLLYRKEEGWSTFNDDLPVHSFENTNMTEPTNSKASRAMTKRTRNCHQRMWERYYRRLKRFNKMHKKSQVRQKYASNPSLNEWVTTQRQLFMTGKLSLEQVAMLNKLKFDWSPGRQRPWSARFEELKQFQSQEGHCVVPKRKNKGLHHWVNMQRSQYNSLRAGKKSYMTQERIAALTSIGFRFEPRRPGNSIWKAHLEQLREYMEKHGNCWVPHNDTTYEQLARWVSRQRIAYSRFRRGKPSSLTAERVATLRELGFVWSVKDYVWNQKLQQYRQISQQHSNHNSTVGQDLARWMKTQKREFIKYQNKIRSSLTEDRIKALRSANFPLEDPNHVAYTSWLERFEQLRAYKEENGSCHIPQRYTANPQLALFVKAQRYHYQRMIEGKKCSITPERVEMLDSIGFEWKAPPFSRGLQRKSFQKDANDQTPFNPIDHDTFLRDAWRKRFQRYND